jgi:cation diffusion facilitator CzcD-associated flavoprotein CzcO
MCDSTEEGCRYGYFDIAIVGGGCSGVLVAVQLLRIAFRAGLRSSNPKVSWAGVWHTPHHLNSTCSTFRRRT